jgi:probable sodium:solute symporter
MTIDPWILAFSAVTVIATIWMGFWSAKKSKTASDFFVAGRSVSVGWNASAISGEYLSAASFMGVAGMVMSSGYDALWYPVCYACGYLFLLLFIAGPLRRFGAYTIPDFAEGRFDSPVFRKIAVVFVLFIGFFYTMPQMKGAGTTLAYIFPGLPYWAGVVLVGAVITLNVALGGMKGITLVQAFQYWAKMFAISVPIFVLMTVYGHYGKQIGVNTQRPTLNSQLSTNALGATLNVESSTLGVERSMLPKSIDEYRAVLAQPDFGMFYLDFTKVLSGPTNTLSLENLKFRLDELTGRRDANMGKTDSIGNMVANYSAVTQKRVSFGRSWLAVTNDITYDDSQPKTRRETLQLMEGILRTNGGFIFPLNQTNVVLLTEADLDGIRKASSKIASSAGRKQLPAKAPRDETWLNPFGPLTTKAAKAAKPRSIRFEGELSVTNATLLNGRLMSFTEPEFLAHNRGPKKEEAITPGTYLASDFVRLYAEVALLGETDSSPEFSARHAKPLEASSLVWTNGTRQPRRELARAMESALTGAGITVLREPGNVFRAFPTKDAVITLIDPRPYSLLYTYSLIIALVCGTAGLPHILVRFYTNPDGVAAKRTTMWVMILIGVFYVFPPVFGVMGRNLLPSLYEGVGAKGTDKVVLELPRILNEEKVGKWESGKVGEATNSAALSPAHAPTFPPVASLQPKRTKIPWGSIFSGITCAGAFAAFMSTFSGLLVSMTGAMAHDVYGRMINPDASPEQRLRAFKIAAVGIGGVAILLGMQVEPLQINFMVGQAFAIAAASYFPLLFVSVWWRKLTMKGAATGMLTGGTLALAGISLTSFTDLKWLPLDAFWAEYPLLRILCEQPAIWAVPLAIALMVVVSKFTSKDVPEDIRMKMLVLHAPEKLGLKQEYIQEHQMDH